MNQSRGIQISPLLGIPLILLIFAGMAFFFWDSKKVDTSWVRTDAVVVDGGTKHRAAVVSFTDPTTQQVVQASASDASFSKASRGDKVSIAYNPNDTTEAKIVEKPGNSSMVTLLPVLLIGGVFSIIGVALRKLRG